MEGTYDASSLLNPLRDKSKMLALWIGKVFILLQTAQNAMRITTSSQREDLWGLA